MKLDSVSVVLPAFNEEEILELTVNTVTEALRAKNLTFEINVVENGSTDNTAAIAQRLADDIAEVNAKSLKTPDYGAALREGFRMAKYDIVVNFDTDYYNIDFLIATLERMADRPEIAIIIGSKRAPGAEDTRAFHRRLVTIVFSTLLRVVFGLNRTDTHGMKAMRRATVAPHIEQCQLTRDLLDTEMVLRVERAGLVTDEIPVLVEETRPARSSIMRRIPRSLAGLFRLFFVLRTIKPIATSGAAESEAA